MSRIISVILVVTSALMISIGFSNQAQAFDLFGNSCQQSNFQGTDVCQEVANENKSGQDPVKHVIAIVIDIISYVVGALAVIFILVSAIKFTTAGGDTNSVSEARSGIIYAIVGIIVIVVSQSFVDFILGKL